MSKLGHGPRHSRFGNAKSVFGAAKAADTTHERQTDISERRRPSKLPTTLDELKQKLGEVVRPPKRRGHV